MSVRMALAKLSAVAAGGALAVGGAVHVAEAPAAEMLADKDGKAAPAVKYVKQAPVQAVASPLQEAPVEEPVLRMVSRCSAHTGTTEATGAQ